MNKRSVTSTLLGNTKLARIPSFNMFSSPHSITAKKHKKSNKQNFLSSNSFRVQHLHRSSSVFISPVIENKIRCQNLDYKWKILSSKLYSTIHLILYRIDVFSKYHTGNLTQFFPPLNSYLFTDLTDSAIGIKDANFHHSSIA